MIVESILIKKIKEMKENITPFIGPNKDYKVYIDDLGNRYVESNQNDFHLYFIKSTGWTAKWGKTFQDDVYYCPFGNEIADIEITKTCQGIRNIEGKNTVCPWCYKSNTSNGSYMSFETYKNIFDKLNASKTTTQIEFGTDAEASDILNPDIWKIMDYTIANNVTPNITVADINEYTAEHLVAKCGAIAVSYYGTINKNCCYNSVKLLLDKAKAINKNVQINIHCILSQETFDSALELLEDYKKDFRLKGLNAIIFLSLKKKGRGMSYNRLSDQNFKKIINLCFLNQIQFGIDSCSVAKFLNSLIDKSEKTFYSTYIESCESCLYSIYIDVNGMVYPCSFMEKEGKWKTGIDLIKIKDFVKDVWYEKRIIDWRNKSITFLKCNGCNECQFFEV